MIVQTLSVQGFRSFDVRQVLRVIDMEPGLWHVAGENGAGKSSLFEALYWGFYGHTSRNLRGGTIKNWTNGKVECEVRVECDWGSVHRTQSPNFLCLDAKPVDQEELGKHIGVSPEAFLHSIYFAQFTDAFVDLRPEARMQMYATVMNLEYWERASDEAGVTSKSIEDHLQGLREAVAGHRARVEILEQTSYVVEIERWESEREEAIKQAEERIKRAQADFLHAGKRLDNLPTTEERDKRLVEVEREALEVARLSREIRELDKEIGRAESARGPRNCPTCGRPMTVKHVEVEVGKLRESLKKKQRECVEGGNRHDDALREVAKLNKGYIARTECEKERSRCEQIVKEGEGEVKRLKTEIKSNPYVAREQERQEQLKETKKELKEAEKQLHSDTSLLDSVRYWVRGYKDIRLSLIEESLEQLNMEVNEAVYRLGLPEWRIRFDVEKETKRGTIKRGFQCLVKSPASPDTVPWEVWSGGESQRLRLAVEMGMANLICARVGVSCNVELYDEPSTWLNEVGIQDLLEVLVDRARAQQKVILLADHRALGFGDFAGIVKITNTVGGSRLEMQ